jgi:hypothetical protein
MVACQAVRATTSSVKPSWSLRSETKSNESLVAWWQGRKSCNLCGQVARDRRVLLVCLATNRFKPSLVRGESPLANKTTSCPRATSSSVSHEMTRSVPPQFAKLTKSRIKTGLAPRALLPAACAPILVRAHFKSMSEYYRGLSVAAGSPSHRSFGALPHSPPLAIRET